MSDPPRHSVPLSHPADRFVLSELMCLVRSQLELFVVTEGSGGDSFRVGRAGIRCKHCARVFGADFGWAGRGSTNAVSFPQSIRLVYQSVRNWQRYHFPKCTNVPDAVRERYDELKSEGVQKRSHRGGPRHWEDCCRQLGMVDDPSGGMIRLRRGVFESLPEFEDAGFFDDALHNTSVDGLSHHGSWSHVSPLVDATAGPEIAAVAGAAPQPVGYIQHAGTGEIAAAVTANGDREGYGPCRSYVSFENVVATAPSDPPAPAMMVRDNHCPPECFQLAVKHDCNHDGPASMPSVPMPLVRERQYPVSGSASFHQPQILVDRAVSDVRHNSFNINTPSPLLTFDSEEELPSGTCVDKSLVRVNEMGMSSNTTMNEEAALMQNLRTALSIVKAASLLRRLQPQQQQAAPVPIEEEESDTRVLSSLGEELYELFAGKPPFPGDEYVSSDRVESFDDMPLASPLRPSPFQDEEDGLFNIREDQRAKRGRVPGGATAAAAPGGQEDNRANKSKRHYVPLGALGVPPAICCLVSSLLAQSDGDDNGSRSSGNLSSEDDDCGGSIVSAGNSPVIRRKKLTRGLHRRRRDYESLSEVEEDLHHLASCPRLLKQAAGTEDDFAQIVASWVDGSSENIALYGRSDEIEVLMDAFDRATAKTTATTTAMTAASPVAKESLADVEDELRLLASAARVKETSGRAGIGGCIGKQKREVVLVSGYSGAGKSSLVAHACRRFIQKGATVAYSKFDTVRQMGPLSALFAAVGDYCDLLARNLKNRDDAGCSWAESVIEAAMAALGGGSGALLAGLVPSLRKLLRQEDDSDDRSLLAPSAPIQGGRLRMRQIALQLRMLFRATCDRNHPTVLCLDDLHWGDELSLELVHALLTDSEIDGLMFVGSFRDNEIGPDHPLMSHLDAMHKASSRVTITEVRVGNLDVKNLNALISDSLRLAPGTTRSLAEAVRSKTGGNALFAVQFLASLRDECLLRFSLATRQWEWDIETILTRDVSDDVVELLVAKMLRLDPEVREALKVAAAFGAEFQEVIFEILDRDSLDNPVGNTIVSLDVAVAEGLMVKTDTLYRFSHDQIQRAAFLLVPEQDWPAFHLRIGRSLWKQSTSEELDSYLFVVVDQLHRGSALITDDAERASLCQLSLMAGKMASSAMSAFLPTLAFLKAGIGLLVEEDWEAHRQLCFDLYNLCAETEFTLGEFDSMKVHMDEVLRRARTLEEKLRAYFTFVQSRATMGHVRDAINTAMGVLRQLGESLPSNVTEETMQSEMKMTRDLFLSKSDHEILHLALMEDPDKLAAMKFLQLITLYVFTEKKDYFPVVVCRMARLSLTNGLCKESAVGFVSYGAFISLRDTSLAYRLGRISLILLRRFRAQEYLARVYNSVYGFINPMVEPIQASLPCLKEAVETGLATGDTEFAMTVAHVYGCDSLFSGKGLGPLAEEVDKHLKLMVEHKQHFTISLNRPLREFILKLLGISADCVSHVWEDQDESMVGTHSTQLGKIYLIWHHYLFGNYDVAWETISGGVAGDRFSHACTCTLYTCLTALALARKERKKIYMDTIDKGVAQMRTWAASAPWNCEHKLELIKAEYANLEGNRGYAAELYDVAIDLAQKRSFIHEQALSLERAGLFHLEHSDYNKASEYFSKAFDCYEKWGAHTKSAHIKENYM